MDTLSLGPHSLIFPRPGHLFRKDFYFSPSIRPGLIAVIVRMALAGKPYFNISSIYLVMTLTGGGFTVWPESVDMMQCVGPTAFMASPRVLGGMGWATWGVQSLKTCSK